MTLHIRWIATLGLVPAVVGAAEAVAQEIPTSRFFFVRGEHWSVMDGPEGAPGARTGLSLGVMWAAEGGAGRLGAGWVPEGGTEQAWLTLFFEAGPGVEIGTRARISGQMIVGGLDMQADKRRPRPCEGSRCFHMPPAFEEGWGVLGGLGLSASARPLERLEVSFQYGWNRILGGANADQILRKWSASAAYRFR